MSINPSTASGPAAPRLDGKVAIVTGASRGIGAGTARAFAGAGAAVVLAARDATLLTDLEQEITAAGGHALSVPTDISDEGAVQRLVDRTVNAFGRLDVAFNNAAGGGHRPTPLADVQTKDYDSAHTVQVRGTFLCLKHQIPAMLATGGGAVVNMASTAGIQSVAGLAAYSSAKAGVIALTRVAALDYAEHGLRINAVAPGPILTDHLAAAGQQVREQAAQAMPLRRIGTIEEVAAAVLWLCTDSASYITGTTLPIDGGKLAGSPAFTRPDPPAAGPRPSG